MIGFITKNIPTTLMITLGIPFEFLKIVYEIFPVNTLSNIPNIN
jgi:hypothetical protein